MSSDRIIVSTGYDNKESIILLNIGNGQKLPDPLTTGSYDLIWWNSSDYINPYDDPYVETVTCEAKANDALIILRKDNSSNKNISGKTYSMAFISNNELKGLSYYNTPQIHGKTKHDPTTVDGGASLSSNTQIPVHGSLQHTGMIGTWGQIDKTTSNITDIAARSHSSLTDGVIPGTTNSHAAIDTAVTNSASHIAATTGIHGITGNLVATGAAVSGQYSSLKYTTTTALNWNNGNVQYIVLASGGQTFTFSSPRDGGRYMIIVKQPTTGAAGTVTWPANVLWSGGTAPTLTTTNGKVDLVTFVYDLTNDKYYGGTALNY